GADPYAVVLAALGAIDGPRHGAASRLPFATFADVAAGTAPAEALAARLRDSDQPPGFGHFLYPDGDPRATVLLELLAAAVEAGGADMAGDWGAGGGAISRHAISRHAIVKEVRRIAAERAWWPNIDFALAALTYVGGMGAEAGEAIF